MDRDDYISKLFIKNQDKLEQAPSADLWSKLEAQLDGQVPVAQTAPSGGGGQSRILSMSRFLVAASILLAVFGSVYLFQWGIENSNQEMAMDIVLEEPRALLTDNSEPYEDAEILPTNVTSTTTETEEIRKQEAKIIKAVNEKAKEENLPIVANSNNRIKLEDISIAEKTTKPAGSIISIEPEVNTKLNSVSSGAGADLYQNNTVVEQRMNYANSIPQISNTADNNLYAEEILSKSKSEKYATKDSKDDDDVMNRRASSRGGIMPSQSKDKVSTKVKSPMATAHARLQPFGFLLGKWIDDNEKEGTSYETWSLKDANTLIGRGFKLSTSKERIFEELMRIEFHNNQVFLVISLDESTAVQYMLTKFDNERFIFEQKETSKYPDKVVLQRNLDGYQTIILNDNDFLTSDQQRFLENRNRVSNVRSIRTMRYED